MLSDTIAALATPPGRSAIAVVRISGADAGALAARVLHPFHAEPHRIQRVRVRHPHSDQVVDDALCIMYPAPRSYTGEDVVEVFSHGGLLVPVEVLGAVLASGARLAAPGEFTRRALQNGKMDLLQAEAVGDLIDATAPAQRRAAIDQLDRGLSSRIDDLRERVLALEALVCYEIDFPEEDSGPVPPERIDDAIGDLVRTFRGLIETAKEGERLREGAVAVIAGRPNTGKSSLFNALLGRERAIVTEVPGTTRDAIEAPATCDGFPFRLVDTAGLRHTDDRVERMGIEVSRRYLDAADVVLFCVEAGRAMGQDEEAFLSGVTAPSVLIRTKADEEPAQGGAHGLPVSVVTGDGIPALREELARLAFSRLASQARVDPLVTRERHRVALRTALDEVQAFAGARASGIETAVASVHLRAAVSALEDVIGVVSTEDVLDRVFATFCIGK
jgi:tRNA modification GTPase